MIGVRRLMQLSGLTASEVQIMELMTEGFPQEAIEKHLRMPEGIVMYAQASIQKKLNVQNRSQAIRAWQSMKAGGPIDLGLLSKWGLIILELMAEGYRTTEAIAEHLGIAQQPIGIGINKIYRTLGVRSPETAVAVWKCLKADPSEPGSN